tara:strand:- start:421 stop:777 length:357 start_codon:yes stop_codon:yes gene_type:complete
MNYYKSTSESQKEQIKRNFYLVRLERYAKDLMQFNIVLNSYTCEPQTEELFEQKYNLKMQLDYYKQASLEIINSIQKKKEPFAVQIDRIKAHLRTLEKLHSDLKEYSYTVQNHSKLLA